MHTPQLAKYKYSFDQKNFLVDLTAQQVYFFFFLI